MIDGFNISDYRNNYFRTRDGYEGNIGRTSISFDRREVEKISHFMIYGSSFVLSDIKNMKTSYTLYESSHNDVPTMHNFRLISHYRIRELSDERY